MLYPRYDLIYLTEYDRYDWKLTEIAATAKMTVQQQIWQGVTMKYMITDYQAWCQKMLKIESAPDPINSYHGKEDENKPNVSLYPTTLHMWSFCM